MTDYILQRFRSGPEATLGAIFCANQHTPPYLRQFKCFTLEDQKQAVKVPKETRIPAGRYEIKFRTEGTLHEKYKKYPFHIGMLHLQDIPGFDWIYIHVGNTDDNTEGCILVGMGADASRRATIQKSVEAYSLLYKEISKLLQSGDRVWIDIQDYAG